MFCDCIYMYMTARCQKLISVEGDGHCCHRPSSNLETNQPTGTSNLIIFKNYISKDDVKLSNIDNINIFEALFVVSVLPLARGAGARGGKYLDSAHGYIPDTYFLHQKQIAAYFLKFLMTFSSHRPISHQSLQHATD